MGLLRPLKRERHVRVFDSSETDYLPADRLRELTREFVTYHDFSTDTLNYSGVGDIPSIDSRLLVVQDCIVLKQSRLEVVFKYPEGTSDEDRDAIREILGQVGLKFDRFVMEDRRLVGIEPGLMKATYPFEENPQSELVLKLSRSLADSVYLPNDALFYRGFLREGMKAAFPSKGLSPMSPFSGRELCDEYVEKVDGRQVNLTRSFLDSETNFNPLLISRNSRYFSEAVNEVEWVLSNEGLDVGESTWEDYKAWEAQRLQEF